MPESLPALVAWLKAAQPALADVPDDVLTDAVLTQLQARGGPSVGDALGVPTFRTSNEKDARGAAVVRDAAPVGPSVGAVFRSPGPGAWAPAGTENQQTLWQRVSTDPIGAATEFLRGALGGAGRPGEDTAAAGYGELAMAALPFVGGAKRLATAAREGMPAVEEALQGIRAYHAAPHDFPPVEGAPGGKMLAMGEQAAEGAQAYDHAAAAVKLTPVEDISIVGGNTTKKPWELSRAEFEGLPLVHRGGTMPTADHLFVSSSKDLADIHGGGHSTAYRLAPGATIYADPEEIGMSATGRLTGFASLQEGSAIVPRQALLPARYEDLRAVAEGMPAVEEALNLGHVAQAQRAAEQGYAIDALHGRSGDYAAVAIPSWKRSSDAGALGEGFYATPATEKGAGIADWYASQAGPRENVMPVKLKLEHPLVIEGTPGSDPRPMAVARLSKEWGLREQPRFSGSKQLNPDWAAEFSQALRARGYDGVVADLGGVQEYMVLAPQQVRSRFAAFDPRQLANPNLLAGLAGGALLAADAADEP